MQATGGSACRDFKKFYEFAVDFLNTNFKDDPLKHAKCYHHLVSELSSEQGRLTQRNLRKNTYP